MEKHETESWPRSLTLCESDILSYARRKGLIGVVFLLTGGVAVIATSNDTNWDSFKTIMLFLCILGGIFVLDAERTIRFLKKGTGQSLNLFESKTSVFK